MSLFNRLRILLGVVILLGLLIFFLGSTFYTDLLWFQNLGYDGVFLQILFSQVGIRILAVALFSLFLFMNLFFARPSLLRFLKRLAEKRKDENVINIGGQDQSRLKQILSPFRINLLFLLVSILLALFFTSIRSDAWLVFLKFLNGQPFGITDPLYGIDLGFYVFRLPFFHLLYELALLMISISALAVLFVYIFTGNHMSILIGKGFTRPRIHLSLLTAIFFLVRGLGYRLDIYNLLYSPRGVVFGASYTDANAQLLALRFLFYLTLVISLFILINIFTNRFTLILGGIALLVVASFLLGVIYPSYIQRFIVEPNEIVRETPYIEYNIKYTRLAYGLEAITRQDFDVINDLSSSDLLNHQGTIKNIRLWDPRPLLSTYRQIQEMRVYYDFSDVDVDRYWINGEVQQVMLSVREMNQEKLPQQAQTWVNQRLQYTHGYGLAMTPVSGVRPNGLPTFLIEDIPPRTQVPNLTITRPEIYYGEKTSPMVITNTHAKEFNYPMGSENVYTSYEGKGGIPLSSFLRRAAFAFRFSDFRILLSDDIHSESRLMFNRLIKERAQRIAPFLIYDQDPYPVVFEGRILWIIDAYTATEHYPYSEPYGTYGNYVRNAVKVVVDAYHGDVTFYLFDEEDPIALTYQAIFPDLFTPIQDLPEGLSNHFRYPEDLFYLQAQILATYHMQNPVVFYNREDMWNIPTEVFMGTTIEMIPYYLVMRLPDEEVEEFVLMLPFTPARRDNMIAWLAARSSPTNYGEMILFDFPKEEWIRGPRQIEAQIDQHPYISQQISLWSQRGSRVVRGNLLVIPINNSILYVEPLYIQAQESELPELARVIVGFGEDLVMEPTLEEALNRIFGLPEEEELEMLQEERPEYRIFHDAGSDLKSLIQQALKVYNEAMASLQDGDFGAYGDQIQDLSQILQRLDQMINP